MVSRLPLRLAERLKEPQILTLDHRVMQQIYYYYLLVTQAKQPDQFPVGGMRDNFFYSLSSYG